MNKQLLPLPSCMCMCQHRSEVYVKEKGTLYSKRGERTVNWTGWYLSGFVLTRDFSFILSRVERKFIQKPYKAQKVSQIRLSCI